MTDLLESFTAAGGQILMCTPCAKTRGVDLGHPVAKVLQGEPENALRPAITQLYGIAA